MRTQSKAHRCACRYSALALLLLSVINDLPSSFAQGTGFTYQGRLNDGGNPANGTYDLRFTVYDLSGAFGTVIAGPITNSATAVSNGLFTVTLDFGAGVFTGASRWLEIGVKTNGSTNAFFTLSPRQPMTATPYAITAANLTGTISGSTILDATITASKMASNQVVTSLNMLHDNVTLQAGTNVVINVNTNSGTNTIVISATGGGGGGGGAGWLLTGNAGTVPGVNFLGTTDNQPLQLHVNGGRAFRLEPAAPGPNVIGGALNSVVASGAATIGGGVNNFVGSSSSTIAGGNGNQIGGFSDYALIGGGTANTIRFFCWSSTIGGGTNHLIQTGAPWSTIGGGANNNSGGYGATIGGGTTNTIIGNLATISGGFSSSIWNGSDSATIAGGFKNTILTNAPQSTIGGGVSNAILNLASYSTIGGGSTNTIMGAALAAMIGGGEDNTIGPGGSDSTISGGKANLIGQSAGNCTIGGGSLNYIDFGCISGTIAGGNGNYVAPSAGGSAIGGGVNNSIQYRGSSSVIGGGNNNTNFDAFQVIGGGWNNTIQLGAPYSFIGSGNLNTIGNNATWSTIGGGVNNVIQCVNNTEQVVGASLIGGGYFNLIQGNGGVLCGGISNKMSSDSAVICGGVQNTIGTNAIDSVVGGGSQNIISYGARYATIAGGTFNEIGKGAESSAIGGGAGNHIITGAFNATIAGGSGNSAGARNSFAAGSDAHALHDNTFVWNDGTSLAFSSTGTSQFLISAYNGVGINKNTPSYALDVAGSINADGMVRCQSLQQTSDRNAKEKFAAIDVGNILKRVADLPISTWNFKQDANTRHIGPMAQDFKAAFEVGTDEKHIATVDAEGVALAAIQGLNQKLEQALQQKEAEIGELKHRNQLLEEGLNELRKTVRAFSEDNNLVQ